MDQRVAVTVLAAAAVPVAIALHAMDPTEGLGIPCPFRTVTGLLCPGCGSGRALHHLLHGEVGLALAHNPLVPPAAAVLGVLYLAWALRSWAPAVAARLPAGRGPVHPPGWVGALATLLLVAFAVARNTAGGEWLSPLA